VHRCAFYSCLAAATMAAAVAGCGSSDPAAKASSPAALVAASQQTAEHYTSVQASGLLAGTGSVYVRVDLKITPGVGAVGHITYRPNQSALYNLEVVRLGETIYFKARPIHLGPYNNFYEQIVGRKAAPGLEGKWVRMSVKSTRLIRTLSAFTELPSLIRGFFDEGGKLSMGGRAGVVGQNVIEVKNDATGEVLDVLAAGKPYPTQILKSGASSVDGIVFDHWGWHWKFTPPSDAVDIEKLNAKA
jgi:hypothetical protein